MIGEEGFSALAPCPLLCWALRCCCYCGHPLLVVARRCRAVVSLALSVLNERLMLTLMAMLRLI